MSLSPQQAAKQILAEESIGTPGRKPSLTAAERRYCRRIFLLRERIPTTAELAKRMNVSENTIRTAYRKTKYKNRCAGEVE